MPDDDPTSSPLQHAVDARLDALESALSNLVPSASSGTRLLSCALAFNTAGLQTGVNFNGAVAVGDHIELIYVVPEADFDGTTPSLYVTLGTDWLFDMMVDGHSWSPGVESLPVDPGTMHLDTVGSNVSAAWNEATQGAEIAAALSKRRPLKVTTAGIPKARINDGSPDGTAGGAIGGATGALTVYMRVTTPA